MALTKKQRKEQKKMDRRHKANQLRKNKKAMVTFGKGILLILKFLICLKVESELQRVASF